MIVTIRYTDGHVECFDSNSLTGGSIYGQDSVLTEFHLTWEEDGAGRRLVAYSHHLEDTRETTDDESVETDRIRGPWSQLAGPEDIPRIESIHVDGQLAAWRQGGCLVDALRFDLACMRWYSGPGGSSANERAVSLFRYLERAHPELGSDEKAICSMFGFPVDAYHVAEDEEMAAARIGCEEEGE